MRKQLQRLLGMLCLFLPIAFFAQPGTTCANPITISGLPFQNVNSTANFQNTVSSGQGGSCGAVPVSTDYLSGKDVFYSYTATENSVINITMTPSASSANSGIFVYDGCIGVGDVCVAGVANPTASSRSFDVNVLAGHNYIILISSAAPTSYVAYSLIVQQTSCAEQPTNLSVSGITSNSAILQWNSGAGASSWEIAVQPSGDSLPPENGVQVSANNYTAVLEPGNQYQFWVRAACESSPGQFSAWTGPYQFSTPLCNSAQTCNYTFSLSNASSGSWGTTRMQVRQNGIVMATLGNGVSGTTPVDVTVPLCNAIPFELFWSVSGSSPQTTIVKVLNSFGQTLYQKPAGTGVPNSVLYSTMVDCAAPNCYLPPLNPVVTNATMTSAVLTWQPNYPGGTQFEILKLAGPTAPSQLPDNNVGASYPTITVPEGGPYTFTVTDLQPATLYYMYVRAVCVSGTTEWVPFGIFNTITCPDAQKCNYRFLLTNDGFNDWNDGAMQVRQNGIVVATLGNALNVNNSVGVIVPLCSGLPFDLYWNAQGTQPLDMGIIVQDPYQETVYAKPAGEGTPLTVLFSSTVDCTPPSCRQPSNLSAASITDASATLSWTENGTAGQWEVYAAPTGSEMPVDGSPVSGTGFYHITTTNSLNLTGLTPLTQYKFYVRAICSSDNVGNWTLSNPGSFLTKFGADNCESAVSIPVTPMFVTNFISASTAYATASSPQPPTGCNGTNDDIWFSFVATSDKVLLKYNPSSISTATMAYILYTGGCGGTPSNCDVLKTKLLTGLTPGDTYYIRAYTPSTSSAAKFQLALQNPSLQNDECLNAVTIPVNTSLAINQLLSSSTAGATTSQEVGCSGIADDVWFRFVATDSTHYIKVSKTDGTANYVNYVIYSGDCEGLQQLGTCSNSQGTGVSGLVPGQPYYVRVFRLSTTNVFEYYNFDISVTTGPALTNDEPTGAVPIAVNPSTECDQVFYGTVNGATPSPQSNCSIMFDTDDAFDVWFVFTATAKSLQISLNSFGMGLFSYGVYAGTPDNLTQMYCGQNPIFSNYIVGQQYYLRVWRSNGPAAFSVCIKTVSTCETAETFCGSANNDPYIFPNTSYVPNNTQIACLASAPNASFYKLRVSQSGPIRLNIAQNTAFDDNGNPIGKDLDVDFVAWGPFTDNFSCDEILYEDCPSCPNNTNNQLFYPFGNIVDCSYSGTASEILNISNAEAGQYYVVMITNFSGNQGYIKLRQINFEDAGSGRTACTDKIRLIAFIDSNNNGVKDANELNFTEGNFVYYKNDSGPASHITTTHGIYDMYDLDPTDSYDFSYEINSEYANHFIAPAINYNNITVGTGSQILYFPVTVSQDYADISITVVPVGPPIAGATYTNKIIYKNEGTTAASGSITFQKPIFLDLLSISEQGFSFTSNGFNYDFSNLAPFESRAITINMKVPSIQDVNLGDLVSTTASVTTTGNDIFPQNNTAAAIQAIVGSYDPNDKTESHGGKITMDELDTNGYLYYTIRFQNTGTYYARDVQVSDVIDPMLDEGSIRILGSSHDFTMERVGNQVSWRFPNINLPAVIQDEANSHGYIAFKIKPKNGYAVGDILSNTAEIYFDTNPAIVTNTVATELVSPLGTPVLTNDNILMYPNPAKTSVRLSLQGTSEILQEVVICDLVGKRVAAIPEIHGAATSIDVSRLSKGVYFVEVITENRLKLIKKLVVN